MPGQRKWDPVSFQAPAEARAGDRHKRDPISYRPPEDIRAWLLGYAERTGQPVNRILTAALEKYRAAVTEGSKET